MEEKTSILKGSQTTLLIFCIIPMLFGAVLLFVEYLNKRADMYLLPEGFKGTATIFFNEPSGIPEKREGQQRIFEIPPSGTLHTQSSYQQKWSNYYYLKPNGRLRQLMYGEIAVGGIPVPYHGLDSVWVQEMNVAQLDSNGRKLTVATIIVKRLWQ